MGIPDSPSGIPASFIDSTMKETACIYAASTCVHCPSMLLDVQSGRPIEVEVIVGEVVRMARARGASVPVSSSTIQSTFYCSEHDRFHSALRCCMPSSLWCRIRRCACWSEEHEVNCYRHQALPLMHHGQGSRGDLLLE